MSRQFHYESVPSHTGVPILVGDRVRGRHTGNIGIVLALPGSATARVHWCAGPGRGMKTCTASRNLEKLSDEEYTVALLADS